VGGLFPAPKFLKGTIENDTYRSPDGLFQVGCPQPKDSYEYKYMAVKELTARRVTTSASALPRTI
jgi:hypothetical protein